MCGFCCDAETAVCHSPLFGCCDASVTIIVASVILLLARVLLTFSSVDARKVLSLHDTNMAALLGRTGLCMAQLQCALAILKNFEQAAFHE